MRRLISRTAACIASVSLALGAAALPCTAGETASPNAGARLTRLSPASRAMLLAASPRGGEGVTLRSSAGRLHTDGDQPAATPSSPSSFFSSTRGKVTLALMGAGAGFAIWSVHHDRVPVKSPVR
ncbi:MAG TPA: hypothetical protein VL225_09455 [Vicinamibacterales bacterium]|nr:hypothetical protein [Vicinamibacterales bacterium]